MALTGLKKATEYGYINRKGFHSINVQIVSIISLINILYTVNRLMVTHNHRIHWILLNFRYATTIYEF